MPTTPHSLLEILRRVRVGKHLGGGNLPLATLMGDIDLLLCA